MTGKDHGQEDGPLSSIRAVKVPVLITLTFLASKGWGQVETLRLSTTTRDDLNGPSCLVRYDITQLDILKTIPVARILVQNFVKLKAKENGRGKRPILLKTSRIA